MRCRYYETINEVPARRCIDCGRRIYQTIHWEFILGNGKKVTVDYYPRWAYCYEDTLRYRTDHFEYRGEDVSSTGYRSDFVIVDPDPSDDGEKEAYEYAKNKIVELTGISFEGWEGQLDLF